MRELENHIRTRNHFRMLVGLQVLPHIRELGLPVPGVCDVKLGFGGLVPQLHAPGQAMTLFRPVHVARIKPMPERHEQLEREINGEDYWNHVAGKRPRHIRRGRNVFV